VKAYEKELARLTLLEALRSRLAWIVVLAVCIAFGAALFLRQVAIIEGDQLQLSLVAALLRVVAVFIVVVFVITSSVRESNDKASELLMSLPLPRWRYLLGKLAGFALVALLLAIALSVPLMLLARSMGSIAWSASLACELLIMAAVALFCVTSLPQVMTALSAAAGVYLLARSVETIRLIAASPLNTATGWSDALVKGLVDVISIGVPDLDRFSQTAWLYQAPPTGAVMADIGVQTAVYVLLIGAASLFDLYRRNL
jgi:hypothetical protein